VDTGLGKTKEKQSLISGEVRPDLLREETLAEIFRNTAQTYPSKTALYFKDTSVSYEELDQWSDAIALELSSMGIGPGATVGIWWPRSIELHVAILGIVKAGAAYVPLDREMPVDRVLTVLKEVNAAACFSDEVLESICPVLKVPKSSSQIVKVDLPSGASPKDWAYVLYTSGSTGKPKGIPITHRQICHLVRSEQSILNIQNQDKVYQGFSVSFDMWCEETWISYLVGATLWVADSTTAKSLDELGETLAKNKITVLHAVPSLLAMVEDKIPSLRLINAGGEACTPQVLNKWAKPDRQFFNTYGPTETTVTATLAALKKGDEITIGKPLPNYGLAVVDEALNLLPRGERGELVISGPGVGEGYIDRPELTRDRFISKPKTLDLLPGNKVYKTGDAAFMNEQGEIYVQGRLDDQIKLRGYRIELGEIEVCLNQLPFVSSAAVAVKKDKSSNDHLVAYLVLEPGTTFDEVQARHLLAEHLPVYMIPNFFVSLAQMTYLPSGKIDRKSLPLPEILTEPTAEELPLNKNSPLDERVLTILSRVFPNRAIQLDQDFFEDLGGHSLLAAELVSRLRSEAFIEHASIKDLYLHRPLSKLVEEWENKKTHTSAFAQFRKVPSWRYLLCGIAQTLALLFVYGLFAFQIFLPYVSYYYILQDTSSHVWAIIAALCSFCLVPPLFIVITVLTKWLVIGRMRPGDYPLWGWYYFRWWLFKAVQKLTPVEYINGTPIYPLYLRLLGVKVAADAQLSAFIIGAEDLVTIGNDVSISSGVVLNNAVVEGGLLKLRSIHLGEHAYIGTSSVIGGGCQIDVWGELKDLSYLRPDTFVKACEVWGGSPAERESVKTLEQLPQPLEVSAQTRLKYNVVFLLLLLLFPFNVLLPLLPSIIVLNELDNAAPDYNFNYLVITPLLAASYVLLFALEVIVFSRVILRRLKPGTYPLYSKLYIRKWFVDQLITLSLYVLHPAYATVYVSSFYRALGAKIGKRTEISTASEVTHSLLEIGEGAFVADAVTLGEDDVRAQQFTLSKTTIGNNSFVGNSALIPQGYHLPGDMLVGVLSVPPTVEQLKSSSAKNWLGSPAMALPRRQESGVYPAHLTTHPSKKRKIIRGIIEFLRLLVPSTALMCFSVIFIAYVHDLVVGDSWADLFLQFPFYYIALVGLPSFLVTVILKWLLIGRYKTLQTPMWTSKVWRSEAITAIYEALSVPFLLEYLKGTLWLPLALRLLGVKIGERVWLNTTDITEFDRVRIGDDAALNDDSGPQTHLFEDRVMKVGSVDIGERTSVGARTVVLYDSKIGNDTVLEALSLVMKGENLPASSRWGGSPVRPV